MEDGVGEAIVRVTRIETTGKVSLHVPIYDPPMVHLTFYMEVPEWIFARIIYSCLLF